MMSNRLAAVLVVMGLALLALSLPAGPAPVGEAVEAAAAPTADPVETGRALFRVKACASCHETGLGGAPNLRHYAPDPAFLRRWLRDPDAVRPGTAMPGLKLDEGEIEALIAFLTAYAAGR